MRKALALALLVAAPAGAQSYRRTQVPGKEICLSWNTREFVFNADAAGSSRTPFDTEFPAIEASFHTWQAVADACSDFHITQGPRLTGVLVGKAPGSEANNVVTFREVSCRDAVLGGDACLGDGTCANKYKCWDHGDGTLGLTTVTFSFKTGTIFDADIELNASPHLEGSAFLFTTVPSPACEQGAEAVTCAAVDVQNTVTHEIGHVFGLDHVDASGSTMEASAPLGETRKRIIDPGTALGFCDTYPKGGPPMPCDEIGLMRRKIIAKGAGTPGLQAIGCASSPGTPLPFALALGLGLALCSLGRRRSG
ncbi:MAG: myxosortase-dependent metalloprotease, MXAN_2677/MXAN_2678 family [Myxococcaceae bacterium]